MNSTVLILGAGDLATGVALRLFRSGMRVLMTELPAPLVVRRTVAFAQAVFDGAAQVEGIHAQLVRSQSDILTIINAGHVPILVDPQADVLINPPAGLQISVLVDARLLKRPPDLNFAQVNLAIGLGPGFTPGQDCAAVVETMRGHTLGRVYWDRPALSDTGVPDGVLGIREPRVLRAPQAGKLLALAEIGAVVRAEQPIASIDGQVIRSPFNGVLRGLVQSGLSVHAGMKIGDIDPRGDPAYCSTVSDKALAIGGGVLEAILSQRAIRTSLWA